MEIEPKKVDSGFFKRNYKDALKMLFRSLWIWLLLFGCLFLIGDYKVSLLEEIILGMLILTIGMELSFYAYENKLSINNHKDFFKSIYDGLLSLIWSRLVFLSFVIILLILIISLDNWTLSNLSKENLIEVNKKRTTVHGFSYYVLWAFAYGLYVANGWSRLGFLSYFIIKKFNILNKDMLAILCEKAFHKNKKYSFLNDFMMLLPIFLTSVSWLVFLLWPIYSIFSYLFFREVFGLEPIKTKVEVTDDILDLNLKGQ